MGGGGGCRGLRNKKNEDGRFDIFGKVFEESEIRFYKRLREGGIQCCADRTVVTMVWRH